MNNISNSGKATPLPSMSALRAFEAAARISSFTRAAHELHLTQGAISHQVRELERQLGARLFQREGRGLTLTEAGRSLLPFVREALDRLRVGAETVARGQRAGVLTVSVSPNFANKWLVPRLGRFLDAHPDIDLRISASMRHVQFTQDDIDIAIRHGEGDWPHLHATRLCVEEVFPVCSPALLRPGLRLEVPHDLCGHVLIHDRNHTAWRQWLTAFGVSDIDAPHGPVFNQASLAVDAAVAGQGVALARTGLAVLDLIGGRLVRPLSQATPAHFAYWIVCPKATSEVRKIARFRAWLLEQAQADEILLGQGADDGLPGSDT